MSREKDPHRRERELCYYFGGRRIPLKHRPSKYSRWIDHPWLEISKCEDKKLLNKLRTLLKRPYSRVKSPGKLHISVVDWPNTGEMGDRMVVMKARDFVHWFGGGFDGREYVEQLEREAREDEARRRAESDAVDTEFLGWTFNR